MDTMSEKTRFASNNISRIYLTTSIAVIITEVTGVITMLIDGIISSRFLGVDVFEHAGKIGKKGVSVDWLLVNEDKICFSLMDLSDHFDPAAFYELHRDESPEQHIGIHTVMTCAGEVRYCSTFNSNSLVVTPDREK